MESQRYPRWILMATNARWAAYLEGSVPTFVGDPQDMLPCLNGFLDSPIL